MIYQAAQLAFQRLFSQPFRAVLWKSLGLTLAALTLIWFTLRGAIEWAAAWLVPSTAIDLPQWALFLEPLAAFFAGTLLALGLAFLIAPVMAIVAQFFLDDAAEVIEREDYPDDASGRPMALMQGLVLSVKFLGIVIVANLCALLLLLIPGVNLIAFFLANGYVIPQRKTNA